MTLFFWQNIISPHQIPYINQLALENKVDKVYLIVEKDMDSERDQMGWSIKDNNTNNVELLVSPDAETMNDFYQKSNNQTYHFYSGIRAFPLVYQAFKMGLKYSLNRGIIVEHPIVFRKPLFLHFFKTLVFDYKYFKHIEHVFAFGEKATNWYKLWNKSWNVHEFAYCVEQPNFKENIENGKVQIVYVGSLISRKNVKLIIQSLKQIQIDSFHLTIIGDGPLKKELMKFSDKIGIDQEITFKGFMSMNEIKKELTDYDILVLPSYYDGWGAVVNEGLMAGLFVLVSDKCGSKTLINERNGRMFNLGTKKNCLKSHLKWSFENIGLIRTGRTERKRMSEQIDGKHIAKYFIDCLESSTQIIPTWKNLN